MRIRRVVHIEKCAIKKASSLIRKAAIWASILYDANCMFECRIFEPAIAEIVEDEMSVKCRRKFGEEKRHQPQNWQKQQENVFRRRRDAVSLMSLRMIALTKSH